MHDLAMLKLSLVGLPKEAAVNSCSIKWWHARTRAAAQAAARAIAWI